MYPAAEISQSPDAWERIAKSWLLEVIERSPLDELDVLPIGWISHEAPPLIAEILGQLTDPGAPRDLQLSPAALERAKTLVAGRDPEVVLRRLPGEFAALQTLMIEALDRDLPERDRREFTRAVARLAEVFGTIQAAALAAIADDPARLASEESGANGLDDVLHALIEEERQTGLPFTLAHFEVEGVERISTGYGADAADQMVEAVAGVLEGQLTGRQRAFRIGDGRLVAVIPECDTAAATALAASVADIVERSQAGTGPHVAVAAGLASYPLHADSATALRDAAEAAAWGARADHRAIAVARAVNEQH